MQHGLFKIITEKAVISRMGLLLPYIHKIAKRLIVSPDLKGGCFALKRKSSKMVWYVTYTVVNAIIGRMLCTLHRAA